MLKDLANILFIIFSVVAVIVGIPFALHKSSISYQWHKTTSVVTTDGENITIVYTPLKLMSVGGIDDPQVVPQTNLILPISQIVSLVNHGDILVIETLDGHRYKVPNLSVVDVLGVINAD